MNEMRLDEPGLLLDVILRPQDAAPEAAAESAVAMGGAAPPSSPSERSNVIKASSAVETTEPTL